MKKTIRLRRRIQVLLPAVTLMFASIQITPVNAGTQTDRYSTEKSVLKCLIADQVTEYVELKDGKIDKAYLYRAIYPRLIMDGKSIDDVRLADDFDEDGLTLAEEYEYDTNPFSKDSDEDGLSDRDEVSSYKTSPIKWDTDEDEMGDGTEIKSGLNPLNKDTDGNGITDNLEKITQILTFEEGYSDQLKDVDNLPIVKLRGVGDFSEKLSIEKITYDATILSINSLVGTAYDFICKDDSKFEQGELSFKIGGKLLKNNKLKDLVIAHFDKNGNILKLLKTTHNKTENTLTAKIRHFGIYMPVNSVKYLHNIFPEYKSIVIKKRKAGALSSFNQIWAKDVHTVIDLTKTLGTVLILPIIVVKIGTAH